MPPSMSSKSLNQSLRFITPTMVVALCFHTLSQHEIFLLASFLGAGMVFVTVSKKIENLNTRVSILSAQNNRAHRDGDRALKVAKEAVEIAKRSIRVKSPSVGKFPRTSSFGHPGASSFGQPSFGAKTKFGHPAAVTFGPTVPASVPAPTSRGHGRGRGRGRGGRGR